MSWIAFAVTRLTPPLWWLAAPARATGDAPALEEAGPLPFVVAVRAPSLEQAAVTNP